MAQVTDVARLANGSYRWTTVEKLAGARISSTWEDIDFVPDRGG
jgi:hypothetical protein